MMNSTLASTSDHDWGNMVRLVKVRLTQIPLLLHLSLQYSNQIESELESIIVSLVQVQLHEQIVQVSQVKPLVALLNLWRLMTS